MPRKGSEPVWRRAFVERLRAAKERAGLSQAQVAMAMRRGEDAVSRWFNEVTEPDNLQEFAKLCHALGVDAGWLLGLGGEPPVSVSPDPRELAEELRANERFAAAVAAAAAERQQQLDRLGGRTRPRKR